MPDERAGILTPRAESSENAPEWSRAKNRGFRRGAVTIKPSRLVICAVYVLRYADARIPPTIKSSFLMPATSLRYQVANRTLGFMTALLLAAGLALPAASAWEGEAPGEDSKPTPAVHENHADHPAGDHGAADTHDGAGGGKAGAAGHGGLGAKLPLWTVIPFTLLLLCIAILPLFASHWWESNTNKGIVVAILAIPLTLYLTAVYGDPARHDLTEKMLEYTSFIILLASLYIISGGVFIGGSLSGTPLANTCLLALGAAIASVIGTTGASVLLIRPLLRANKTRQNRAHIVIFFIFIVSNCGGLLTPLGDPPLFMGFLKGVPFEWTLIHLWPQWLVVNIALLVVFHVWDQVVLDREEKDRPGSQLEEAMKHEPMQVQGLLNFVFLIGVVAVIFCAGKGYLFAQPGKAWPWGIQEGLMVLLAAAAYFTTSPKLRENNKFTFGPIIEVAVLFIGIFITMAPALQILNAWGNNAPTCQPAR